MAQRLIQLVITDAIDEDLEAYCEPARILSVTRDERNEKLSIIQMAVEAEKSEKVLDRLEKVFGNRDGFSIAVFPLEALIPRPQEPEAEEKKQAQAVSQRISREELYQEVTDGLRVSSTFLSLVLLSSVVAAIGLYRDDTAILIGAMVIAPLLTPNVALSLAAILGDSSLASRAFRVNFAGVCLSLAVAVMMGIFLDINPELPAILKRSNVGVGDLVLALASGTAGVLAFTSGLPSALIGVMVAVALMPPLVAFGMLLGAGYLQAAMGPLLLLATNVICLNLAGVMTFAAKGIRPRTWWEATKAKTAVRIAILVWSGLLLALLAIVWHLGNLRF